MTREEREEVIAILESYKSTEDQRTEYLLHHGYDNTKEAIKRKEALDEAIKALSVPEREKGEWIEKEGYDGDTYYDCSACGNSWITIEGTPWNNGMDFCPNCGADMRGGKE